MDCEICGKRLSKRKMVELEGAELIVCENCARFGKEKAEAQPEEPVAVQGAPTFRRPLHAIRQPRYAAEKMDLGFDIVPGFGKAIRGAREQKGLTVKELAMKVFEKESLLHRVESEAIKPPDSLIAKLEKALGIKLKGEQGE